MYQRLEKLLEPMQLTREYYTLAYHNFVNIMEFLDYIKLLKEQIDAIKVTIFEDKQIFFCLSIALLDVAYFRSLIQIWWVTSYMTAKKAREMLLKEQRRDSALMINNYLESTTAIVI